MTIAIASSSQNLTSAPMLFTTNFGTAFRLSLIMLRVDVETTRGTVSQSPVTFGIQENIEVWYKSSASDVNYDTLIHAGGFNGRLNYVFAPVTPWLFELGAQLLIKVTNKHGVGTVYGTVTAESA